MITVRIRKQGGAAIMTIPAKVLEMLNIGVDSTLELDLTDGGFVAHPTRHKRLTLKELLHGVTPKKLQALHEEIQWAREGKAVGRELA